MHRVVIPQRELEQAQRGRGEDARDHHSALVGERDRGLRVAPCAFHVAPGGPQQRAHRDREEALRLLVGLERDLYPLLGVAARLGPAAGEELDPTELREDPRQRALLGTFLGVLAEGAEQLARLRELVYPAEARPRDRRSRWRRPERPGSILELSSALERRSPFVPTSHRVDQAQLAQPRDLRTPAHPPARRG